MSSLPTLAGLGEVLDESCGNDAEDELELVLEDNRNEFFCLAQTLLPLFGQVWLLTTGPLVGITVLFAEQACHRGFTPSRRAQGRERTPVLPHLLTLLLWL